MSHPYLNRSLENIKYTHNNRICTERWKWICGYEGVYKISNLGRLKSVSRWVKRKGWQLLPDMILKQRLTKYGYLTINLKKGNIKKWHFAHVLVAKHFISNNLNLPQVHHKQGDKKDNLFLSLKWVTSSENIAEDYKMGTRCQKGERHASNKLTNVQVLEIFNSKELVNTLALKYNVCEAAIYNIKSGFNWSHVTNKQYKRTLL